VQNWQKALSQGCRAAVPLPFPARDEDWLVLSTIHSAKE
jgi:hypothetical protein